MPFLRWVAHCNFVQKWRLKPSLIHQSLSNRKVFVSIVVSVVSPYSLAKKRTGAGDTCHHHFWHRFKSTKNSFFFHFSLYPFSNTTTYITFFSVFTITRSLEQNVSEYHDIIVLEFIGILKNYGNILSQIQTSEFGEIKVNSLTFQSSSESLYLHPFLTITSRLRKYFALVDGKIAFANEVDMWARRSRRKLLVLLSLGRRRRECRG